MRPAAVVVERPVVRAVPADDAVCAEQHHAARPQESARLGDHSLGMFHVFKDLAAENDVERRVLERQCLCAADDVHVWAFGDVHPHVPLGDSVEERPVRLFATPNVKHIDEVAVATNVQFDRLLELAPKPPQKRVVRLRRARLKSFVGRSRLHRQRIQSTRQAQAPVPTLPVASHDFRLDALTQKRAPPMLGGRWPMAHAGHLGRHAALVVPGWEFGNGTTAIDIAEGTPE